ncbi:MAG: triose-phosphate isomerase [Tissierellia bacterium]|nr:triose-phosphate isomerase [Tissierellia bacterium]
MRRLKTPFLIVNPKAYIYGKESLELAKICEAFTKEYNIDIIFTAQACDLRMIRKECKNIFLTAGHMDALKPGRGMGYILPEGLKDAGIDAVVLNHAEHKLNTNTLVETLKRAKELEILTIVCADTKEECKMIANLKPDVMILEPTSGIGTGQISDDEYIKETTEVVRNVCKDIQIIQAAGVKSGDDVYKVLKMGADGSGGTSGILKADSPKEKIREMLEAIKRFKDER